MNSEEVILFFRRIKTRDVIWLLVNAKLLNAADWVIEKSYALQQWGANARKSRP